MAYILKMRPVHKWIFSGVYNMPYTLNMRPRCKMCKMILSGYTTVIHFENETNAYKDTFRAYNMTYDIHIENKTDA